jgi:heme-degrading monooxygenase HmoA
MTYVYVIISFPPIKEGKDAEFQKWFASSNQAFAGFEGFISRKLLRPLEGGNYAAIVEFDNYASFHAMHGSPIQAKEAEKVQPIFNGRPTPRFYEVVHM